MKKSAVTFILLCAMLIYPAINLISLSYRQTPTDGLVSSATDILERLSDTDILEAQQKIESSKKSYELMLEQKEKQEYIDSYIKDIESGKSSYRKAYKDVVIAGDSIMEGLAAYGILSSSNLITQVSASLNHLSDNIPLIAKLKPSVLILHYGLNHLDSTPEQPGNFVRYYTKLILSLQKELPETRIIVSGIFPVEQGKSFHPRFERIDEFNAALLQMCRSTGAEYLDNSALFRGHPEYYSSDGIHLNKVFYYECWLKYIIKEKELV